MTLEFFARLYASLYYNSRVHSVSHCLCFESNHLCMLPLYIEGLFNCTQMSQVYANFGNSGNTPGGATCGTLYDVCCTISTDSNGDPYTYGTFNCYDGDPDGNQSENPSLGDGSQYYGYGTKVPGYNFMCIDDGAQVSNWQDPNSTTVGDQAMAPLCSQGGITSRRMTEKIMEQMYSAYVSSQQKGTAMESQLESEAGAGKVEFNPAKDDDIPSCRMGIPIADVRRFEADQCNPSATPNQLPLEIISRDGKTVTFTLSQVWKPCSDGGSSANNNMDWIAADFVVPGRELECFKTFKPKCGIVNAFTAKCTEGLALIDIYALDETATGNFYQTDGSALTIPDACAAGDKKGDPTKACKFRYALSCMEMCEIEEETWWAHLKSLVPW